MVKTVTKYTLKQIKEIKQLESAKLFLLNQALPILTVCIICSLLNFRGNVIDMQFLPIKLPPVHAPHPPIFYKSTHITLDENHKGNYSDLMVPTSKIWVLAHRLFFSSNIYHKYSYG